MSHTQIPPSQGTRPLEVSARKNSTPESPTRPTPAALPVPSPPGRGTPLTDAAWIVARDEELGQKTREQPDDDPA